MTRKKEGSPLNDAGPRQALAHDPEALAEAERLLLRYPDISSAEHKRLGRFLRSGAPIDIGLLSSKPELWFIAERFKAENPAYFRIGRAVFAGWAVAVTAIIGALILIKDIGIP